MQGVSRLLYYALNAYTVKIIVYLNIRSYTICYSIFYNKKHFL